MKLPINPALKPMQSELLIGAIILAALLALNSAFFHGPDAGLIGNAIVTTTVSASLYGVMALLLWRARDHAPQPFGWANRITLLRGVLLIWLAGALINPDSFDPWTVATVALLILSLDGVDGFLARRLQQASEFGARFDMEVDAALILLLCLLLAERLGAWVLVIGLLRYGFLMAMSVWPWLAQPLPGSFRRKLVCVWQVASLIVALVPGVPLMLVNVALGSSLLLLLYSFAVDILWLRKNRKWARTLPL